MEICVTRETGRKFAPLILSVEQQAVLSMHRVRQGFVTARTAQANQIRGLLAEFGIVLKQWHYSCELSQRLEKILALAFPSGDKCRRAGAGRPGVRLSGEAALLKTESGDQDDPRA